MKEYGIKPYSKPRSIFIIKVLQKPVTHFLFFSVLSYVLLIVFFAFIYQILSHFFCTGVPADFWNCLYFSTVTQTTLGYGDILPLGPARIAIIIQTILGVFYLAFSMGLIIYRLMLPIKGIYFDPYAVFSPDDGILRVRIVNGTKQNIFEALFDLFIKIPRRALRPKGYSSFRIKLKLSNPPPIEGERIWYIASLPVDEKYEPKDLETVERERTLKFSPYIINKETYLLVYVRGSFESLSNFMISHRYYNYENILCGKYPEVEDEIDKPGIKDWKNWGKTPVGPNEEACKICKFYEKCNLCNKKGSRVNKLKY